MPWKELLATVGKKLGHWASDTTVANVLRKHGLPRVDERRKEATWRAFAQNHMNVPTALGSWPIHISWWMAEGSYEIPLIWMKVCARVAASI